ncbi:MAG: hypothetical protein SGI72_12580 [Planctomycetota bacterium]|nr:hypothetical protein [Planctomycetota bacterium]
MQFLQRTLSLCAAVALAQGVYAQVTFPELEPNSQRPEANVVTGILPGDFITGTTTGTVTTLGSTLLTSVDLFRVQTTALPLGIYKHTLTLSTSTTTGNTGTIRGLNQTGTAGTASTGGTPGTTDSTIQLTSTLTVPPRFNQWYAFGKQEEIYYRVSGTTATTATYTATFATAPVTATPIAGFFESGAPITITTIGETTANTDIAVYDANLSAINGFNNDDEGPAGATTQSRLTRTFAPGTYYVAVSSSNTAWNFPAAPDEDTFSLIMDFPDSLVRSSTTTVAADWDFRISACNGDVRVVNQLPANAPYEITWFQINVAAGAPLLSPPPNDVCASATLLPGTSTVTGNLAAATNDALASCDAGGTGSRDLWYSISGGANGGLLSLATCGTTAVTDTVVTVYNSCGGTELACSDDCGGTPCTGPTSCLSGIPLAAAQLVSIRVSDKGLGGCGEFVMAVTFIATPPPNDDCNTPIVLPGPGLYAFDTTSATTGTQGQGLTIPCATTSSIKKDIWYTYTAASTGTLTLTTCGLTTSTDTDTKITVYNGAGCPVSPSGYACDDDSCTTPFPELNTNLVVPITCGQVITIQLGNYSTALTVNIVGSMGVTESGTPCATPSTTFCTGDAVGTTCLACGNNGAAGRGCANSGFAGGTRLANSGIASVSADTLVLTTTDITGPGLFFQANGLAANPITFGDGMLCAAAGILRLGVVFPTAGSSSYPGGLTPNPITIGGGPIFASDVKHYQCWYRDAIAFCTASTFNTSNGISLTWGP